MRKLLIAFFLMLFLFSVFAVNIEIDQNPDAINQPSNVDLSLIKADIQVISAKLDTIPTTESFNDNFAQLDARTQEQIKDYSWTMIAFFIGILIMNNLFILAIYVVLKGRGYV